jgi:hypothetical protein
MITGLVNKIAFEQSFFTTSLAEKPMFSGGPFKFNQLNQIWPNLTATKIFSLLITLGKLLI